MQELRDGLNNSIRGARYHWRKMGDSVTHAVALLGNTNGNLMESQDENYLNQIDADPVGADNIHANETEVERRFDSDVCFNLR
jgi:hypothetical protein